MTSQQLFTACLLFCAALLVSAVYLQYIEGLEPCPLCILQRGLFILLAFGSLIAVLHKPAIRGQRLYAGCLTIIATVGAMIAGRQVWLQHLPSNETPACGPGLNYLLETLPLTEVLRDILSGSGECAVIDWTFLGQSLAMWSLLAFVILALTNVYIIFRNYSPNS